jgi:hypothetical protein
MVCRIMAFEITCCVIIATIHVIFYNLVEMITRSRRAATSRASSLKRHEGMGAGCSRGGADAEAPVITGTVTAEQGLWMFW